MVWKPQHFNMYFMKMQKVSCWGICKAISKLYKTVANMIQTFGCCCNNGVDVVLLNMFQMVDCSVLSCNYIIVSGVLISDDSSDMDSTVSATWISAASSSHYSYFFMLQVLYSYSGLKLDQNLKMSLIIQAEYQTNSGETVIKWNLKMKM